MNDQNARILIVDDEELIVQAMRKYFTGLGYAVDAAYELEEARPRVGSGSERGRHRAAQPGLEPEPAQHHVRR